GVIVWEIESGREVFRAEVENVWSVAFSPDGKRLAYGAGSTVMTKAATGGRLVPVSGSLVVRDLERGCVTWRSRGPLARLGLAFSHGGKRLAGASGCFLVPVMFARAGSFDLPNAEYGGGARVWDAETGRLIGETREPCSRVGFMPDGRLITGGRNCKSLLWKG